MKQRHHSLQIFADKLRNEATIAERKLWRHLQCRRLDGVKFRRQQAIERYIVDFISFEKRLVIELDGGQHLDDERYDRHRDECLHRNGFTVLRFWDNEVMQNLEGVLEVIRQHCSELPSPTP